MGLLSWIIYLGPIQSHEFLKVEEESIKVGHVESKKKKNELIYKTEIDSQA